MWLAGWLMLSSHFFARAAHDPENPVGDVNPGGGAAVIALVR
jgi:hypothetical protein